MLSEKKFVDFGKSQSKSNYEGFLRLKYPVVGESTVVSWVVWLGICLRSACVGFYRSLFLRSFRWKVRGGVM